MSENNEVFKSYFKDKTVAIVGNAESVFEKNDGQFIDSHDIVIRMNRTGIFYDRPNCVESLGEKIDVWAFWDLVLLNPEGIIGKASPMRDKLDQYHKNGGTYKILDIKNRGNNRKRVGFIFDDLEVFKEEKLKGFFGISNPSTGLLVMKLVSLANFSQVNVFGFDWKKTPSQGEPYFHKYTVNGIDKRNGHDFNKEKKYAFDNYLNRDNWSLY